MEKTCDFSGHREGYIIALNPQNAESVVLNVGCVYLPPEYSVLFSHLFIISTLIYINHGCYLLRKTHVHKTYRLMAIETSPDDFYKSFVVCTRDDAEISTF
jgi:hypothetical protein